MRDSATCIQFLENEDPVYGLIVSSLDSLRSLDADKDVLAYKLAV